MKPRIFIADDDEDFRESVMWLLEGEGLETTGFANADAFLEQYGGEPGCLLLDVRMNGTDGISAQRILAQRDAPLAVIILTGHADVGIAVDAMKLNAIDFIEKPFDGGLLVDAVRRGLAVAEERNSQYSARADLACRFASLSQREAEVYKLALAGETNKSIAQQLEISVKTVELHRSGMMRKMQFANARDMLEKSALLAGQT